MPTALCPPRGRTVVELGGCGPHRSRSSDCNQSYDLVQAGSGYTLIVAQDQGQIDVVTLPEERERGQVFDLYH